MGHVGLNRVAVSFRGIQIELHTQPYRVAHELQASREACHARAAIPAVLRPLSVRLPLPAYARPTTSSLTKWRSSPSSRARLRVCRRAGRKVGTKVQGDLTDDTHWDAGIQSALRSTKKRVKCPTHCALISAIQKKTKVWAQDACSGS